MRERINLSISSTSDNAAIIGVRHDLGLENIVSMTRMKREFNTASFPVPEDNPQVIGTGDEKVTFFIEADSVDTTSVLLQLPEQIKSKDKILKQQHKIN